MVDALCFARIRPAPAAVAPFLRVAGSSLAVEKKKFSFDAVFQGSEATQQAVFDTVGAPCVQRIVGGQNVAFVATGQALAGKRWTLLGDLDSPAALGLVPRAIAQLLATVAGRGDAVATGGEYELRLSWVEVHQERCFDLLRYGSDELELVDSPVRGPHLQGLSEVSVDSAEAALDSAIDDFT